MHSAPPVGRGLDAGQELRSPQEASSSWRKGIKGGMAEREMWTLGIGVLLSNYLIII